MGIIIGDVIANLINMKKNHLNIGDKPCYIAVLHFGVWLLLFRSAFSRYALSAVYTKTVPEYNIK